MRRCTPVLILALVLSLLATGGAAAQSDADIERRAGDGRVETAVDVALTDWAEGADTVLLATAGNYPDALAAAPLAASLGAPLLLTPTDSLPAVVGEAIDELAPSEVLVLGGTSAVSDAVVRAVRDLPSAPDVDRIAGDGRFDTAALIAARAGAPHRMAILATGGNFADALAAGATAGTPARPPVLLANADSIPPATEQALRDLRIEHVVILGGTNAIDGGIDRELHDDLGVRVTRLAGPDRFTTAATVLHALPLFGEVPDRTRVVVATGTEFPDALTAGPLAARLGAALTLAAPTALPAPIRDELQLRPTASAVLVGGVNALTRGVEDGVRASFDDPAPVTRAEGRTLVVDGDPVQVSEERWRTSSIDDEGTAPTFTLLGAAAGELVDLVITDLDIRRVDDDARAGMSYRVAGASGLPQEERLRNRPLALHGDDDTASQIGVIGFRMAGCPCTVRISGGFGFDSIFNSYEVRGSYTLRAVRRDVPSPPLVTLPHARQVELTEPGQAGGFDALLQRGQVISIGHRDGSGFQGHFNEHPPGVAFSAHSTNLFGNRLGGGGQVSGGQATVVEERSGTHLVTVSDRYRFELTGTDWMTGQASVFARLPEVHTLTDDEPVTVTTTEPGQFVEVRVRLEAGEEVPLTIAWDLDREGLVCEVLAPGGDKLERPMPCSSNQAAASRDVTLRAERSGVHRIFLSSFLTGIGDYSVTRR
jgi:putative cell wall-binding protein